MRWPDLGDAIWTVAVLFLLAVLAGLIGLTIFSARHNGDCRRRGYEAYDGDAGACYTRVYEAAK